MSTWIVRFLQMKFILLACWALVGLATTLPASGQTLISGAIAENGRWTTEQWFVLVLSGHLIVGNGATLDIPAGAIVHVPAGPFVAAATDIRLEHLLFQYGSGTQVHGGSPTFNYRDLRDKAGAASSIDLGSPVGAGNRASGSGINGAEVPAGPLTGPVGWGFLGIPYEVEAGVLSVGRSPKVGSARPNILRQRETATIEVVGTRLDGLVEARFGREGVVVDVFSARKSVAAFQKCEYRGA